MSDPEALRNLIEDIFIRQQVWSVLWVLVAVALALGSSFLSAFFERRGEHYATKKDFDSMLDQLKRNTNATETIKARIGRETAFAQHVQLEQYKLASVLETRIVSIATDLKRYAYGMIIADLFRNEDFVPLTQVFDDLQSNQWLLQARLHEILSEQAQLLNKNMVRPALELHEIAEKGDKAHWQNVYETDWEPLESKHRQLQERFGNIMNEVFDLDQI